MERADCQVEPVAKHAKLQFVRALHMQMQMQRRMFARECADHFGQGQGFVADGRVQHAQPDAAAQFSTQAGGVALETIDFAKQLDCETIQVSIAHAFPGTEFFDFAKEKGFITNEAMSDDGGHQMAHIEYPGLPVEYVMEMVHKFYDEYYFRPKAAFRVVWQAIINRDVPRLYTEAKSFMSLRAQRNKASRAAREANATKAQESVSMNA